jgi:hypothetical protein
MPSTCKDKSLVCHTSSHDEWSSYTNAEDVHVEVTIHLQRKQGDLGDVKVVFPQ